MPAGSRRWPREPSAQLPVSKRRDDPRRRLSRPRVPGEPVEPVSVGDAAALVGAELGLADPVVFSRVVAMWPELVGETLAARSRVRGVRDGVLEVAVDSPAWATELRYLESELVARASRQVGDGVVRSIHVVVRPPDPPAPERGPE
jgi:predicted nucleic acid-binding Zn ribbon protein